jgi:hypothetical protein
MRYLKQSRRHVMDKRKIPPCWRKVRNDYPKCGEFYLGFDGRVKQACFTSHHVQQPILERFIKRKDLSEVYKED